MIVLDRIRLIGRLVRPARSHGLAPRPSTACARSSDCRSSRVWIRRLPAT